MKGPVPMGSTTSSLLSKDDAASISVASLVRYPARGANGLLVVITRVYSSGAVTDSTGNALMEEYSADLLKVLSKLSFAASALKGVPSWKLTPSLK